MHRAAALDGAGELLELRGEDLQFGGKRLRVSLGGAFGRLEQGFQHHRDAWQDRFLDPVERLFQARLLLVDLHGVHNASAPVKPW